MAIMSQLFWGVTIGALTSAFSLLAKGLAAIFGLGAIGWYGFRRHRDKRSRIDRED